MSDIREPQPPNGEPILPGAADHEPLGGFHRVLLDSDRTVRDESGLPLGQPVPEASASNAIEGLQVKSVDEMPQPQGTPPPVIQAELNRMKAEGTLAGDSIVYTMNPADGSGAQGETIASQAPASPTPEQPPQ